LPLTKAPQPSALPKTVIYGGKPDPVIETDDKQANKPKPKRHTVKKRAAQKPRKTVKKLPPIPLDEEHTVELSPYKLNNGAIELPKDTPVDLSENVKAQIELEIHQARNAVGEDTYHSGGSSGSGELYWGGAAVVDNKYAGVRLDEQGNISDLAFENRVKEILTKHDISFLPKVVVDYYKSLPDKKQYIYQYGHVEYSANRRYC
jgi:hypothetical protein